MGFKQYGDSNSANRLYETTASINLYVETTGNDTTGDGTAGNPFLTIQKAIGDLPAVINNDCYIYVGAGTYADTTVIRKLTTASDDTVTSKYLFIVGDPTELLAEQTAEGGTRTTITDTGAFTGEDHSGKFVELLAGPNFIPDTYYWFSNYFPIRSNTNDVLTLGCSMASLLTAATHYRIVENATIIEGDGTSTHYGLTNYSPHGLEVHIQNMEFTKSYFGINNHGRAWSQGCSFKYDTVGYSGVMCNVGGHTLVDGNYFTGGWTNADIGMNSGLEVLGRQNYMYDSVSGIENDSGNYFFSYGNVVDTMSKYGAKAVNSGIVKGSDNANTGTEYSNCALQAFYPVIGGQINEYNATGAGSAEVSRTIGASDLIYSSAKLTATDLYTFDDDAGRVTDRNDGTLYTKYNNGGNGAVYKDGVSTELITVPALAANANSVANLIPANSFVVGAAVYVTDGIAGPGRLLDLGPTGGTQDLYINDLACNAVGATTNMFASGATFQHMTNYFSAAANTVTVTLDGATPVGDLLIVRVVIWYKQIVNPTS